MESKNIKNSKFLKSMKSAGNYVDYGLPEIAIAGRSNAGKSSLINCITNNSKLAKVSSTPGKTRLVNFFMLNNEIVLTDLPGYGYAKVSKQEKATWDKMVSDYFETTDNLRCVFVLMDIRHLPNDFDKQMLYYSQVKCLPFVLVETMCPYCKVSETMTSVCRTRAPAPMASAVAGIRRIIARQSARILVNCFRIRMFPFYVRDFV